MMNCNQKVCLVDDDPESLQTAARFIRAAGYLVETCESGMEFLHGLDYQNTFCIVFDMNMHDVNGLDLQRILASEKHGLPIIFVAEFVPFSTSVEAMRAGAIDFLEKPLNRERLLSSIQEAVKQHQRSRETAVAISHFRSLTQREREVFELVTTGMLNKQIAARLGVVEKTIKMHRGRVMKKLEVQSVAELVRLHDKLAPMSTVQSTVRQPVDLVTQAAHFTTKVQWQDCTERQIGSRDYGSQK